ncbi:MAG: HAD family hydrolase [Pseudomarimonas sp.]
MPLILALTLDLDDTLWPIWPVIERAEAALQHFLQTHAPRVAERWPVAEMRLLRDRIAAENPHLAHDFTAQRKLSLQHALADVGADLDLVEPCFQAFIAARHQVELYPDVPDGLARLAAQWRLAALTNGNADVQRIGLGQHFQFAICARDFGAAKPDAGIFLAACERLNLPPSQVLHVGDDPQLDVVGAALAGMPTCWVNRHQTAWPTELPRADIEIADLHQLADWLLASALPSQHHPS